MAVAPFYRPKPIIITLTGSELVAVETPSVDNTRVTTQQIADLANGSGNFAYIVPAGSNQGTATPIVARVSVAVSGTVDTGVILPADPAPGVQRMFVNRSGSEKLVYPSSAWQIESNTINDPAVVVDGGSATFTASSDNIWWAT